jgi:4-carboxymuconolactone decarboxylase
MKPLFLTTLSLLLCLSYQTAAQPNLPFSEGTLAPNVHHTGKVWLNNLTLADSIFDYGITIARFAAGAKLNWHTHPKGQQLLILDGAGLYQERGKPLQVVQKGDIVKCAPNVEHWHAATPDEGVIYLAITGNAPTKWLEAVPEAEFEAIDAVAIRAKMTEAQLIKLSRDKWTWMADKNVELLETLFHENSVFVHMGGSWGKQQEIEVIKSGGIHYKKADIHEVSVQVMENTAVLLNKITLLAVVGGNEVTNPFMVTEVYKQVNGSWKLAALSFTRLLN